MNISGIFMAIFDLFPVVLFLVGGIYYQRMLYNKMSKGALPYFQPELFLLLLREFLKQLIKFC